MYHPFWSGTPAPNMFGVPDYGGRMADQFNANTQMQNAMYVQQRPQMALIEGLFGGGSGGGGGLSGLLQGLLGGSGGIPQGMQSTNSPQALQLLNAQGPLSGLFAGRR